MAEVEVAIYNIFKDDASVGAIAGDRIYPALLPQSSTLPAVTYQQLAGPRDHTHDGSSGLVESLWQVNCVAETYKLADELATAVRNALDDYSGTKSSVRIQAAYVTDEGDIPEIVPENPAMTRYIKRLDFEIFFNE